MDAIWQTTFSSALFNENVWIPIKISLKFVPNGRINNISALVQLMAWRRPGDKPLSEPMMVSLTTHICVTRPQWVKLISSMYVKNSFPNFWHCIGIVSYRSSFNVFLWISDPATLRQKNYSNTGKFFILPIALCLSISSVQGRCAQQADVHLTGLDITAIPRNLSADIGFLSIDDTSICVLNLTLANDYPALCRLEVRRSPVSVIVVPDPPSTPPLTHFRLGSGSFPTPPYLGNVLAGEITLLMFNFLGITSIPDKFFQSYTNLGLLSLGFNPITFLNTGSLEGLQSLKYLFLSNTNINPLPPLYLWLPNLVSLSLNNVGLMEILANILENLPNLQRLILNGNQLTIEFLDQSIS